ncbi:Bgt-3594 [Blumeria graminis f. sp. tritici]|uniref:Bgt-3594 n=2 Tax=Blumeria graminis f. sp. tritici TaxID=62690 RepID=A0A061HH73_BLUGR|nr:hypothetical protein BGT96224_3594 [Blumeria graminis f. sp. tritici 96224]VCU39678.1 Bgt-3594 [Blumeria graminis f. sp. tritici]
MGLLMSTFSPNFELNEHACSASNLTWQFIHQGHLPLIRNMNSTHLFLPNQVPCNYAACTDMRTVLPTYGYWDGSCQQNSWDQIYLSCQWNNWLRLRDSYTKLQDNEGAGSHEKLWQANSVSRPLKNLPECYSCRRGCGSFLNQDTRGFTTRDGEVDDHRNGREDFMTTISCNTLVLGKELTRRANGWMDKNKSTGTARDGYVYHEKKRTIWLDDKYPNPAYPGPTISNPSSRPKILPPPRLLDFNIYSKPQVAPVSHGRRRYGRTKVHRLPEEDSPPMLERLELNPDS